MSEELRNEELPQMNQPAGDYDPVNPPQQRFKALWVRWRRSRTRNWLTTIITITVLLFTFLQIKDYVMGKIENNQEQTRLNKRMRILVPLYATKKECLNFLDKEEGKHIKFDKQFFSKKVSRDVINAIEAASQKWFSMQRGTKDILSEKQVDFYFFPEGYVEDDKSYEAAFSKALREAQADGYEVAGVIGNITSTATVEYGKLCGKKTGWDISKDKDEGSKQTDPGQIPMMVPLSKNGSSKQTDLGQIPMILPLSTAANVPQLLRGLNVPAVLRLPPDNEVQSKLLANFLLGQGEKPALKKPVLKTLVIRDLSNKTYSNDLIDNIRELYVQMPLKDAQEVVAKIPKQNQDKLGELMAWGNILAVVPAGGEEGSPPIFPFLDKFSPEVILVCGMTNVSLEILAQVNVSKTKPKYVILTDGAVDEYLLPRIAKLVSQKSNMQVYLSFPLETSAPDSVVDVINSLTDEKDKQNLEMTHALYVIDSVYITLTLLNEGIFNDKSADEARKILVKKMKSLYENGPKEIGIKVPSHITYTFDSFGNSMNLKYHMFRMCLPHTSDCLKNEKGPVWVSAETPVEKSARN